MIRRERAIILRTLPLRESDLLLTTLSEQRGKVQLLARGARRSKKRFMGGLEAFDCGSFEFDPANSVLHFNRGLQWSFPARSLEALLCAALCLETSERFCALEDETCGTLFSPLFRTLQLIERGTSIQEYLAVAVFYCLLVLQHAGIDWLSSEGIPQSAWIERMMNESNPIVPADVQVFSIVPQLLNFIEQEAQAPLQNRSELEALLRRLLTAPARGNTGA